MMLGFIVRRVRVELTGPIKTTVLQTAPAPYGSTYAFLLTRAYPKNLSQCQFPKIWGKNNADEESVHTYSDWG